MRVRLSAIGGARKASWAPVGDGAYLLSVSPPKYSWMLASVVSRRFTGAGERLVSPAVTAGAGDGARFDDEGGLPPSPSDAFLGLFFFSPPVATGDLTSTATGAGAGASGSDIGSCAWAAFFVARARIARAARSLARFCWSAASASACRPLIIAAASSASM